MSRELNANDVVNGLLEQVGMMAREIALLKVQLSLVDQGEKQEESKDDNN